MAASRIPKGPLKIAATDGMVRTSGTSGCRIRSSEAAFGARFVFQGGTFGGRELGGVRRVEDIRGGSGGKRRLRGYRRAHPGSVACF